MTSIDSTITYADSINMIGTLHVGNGYHGVAYSYGDGVAPFDYGSATGGLYQDMPGNDILWVNLGSSESKNYEINNDSITLIFKVRTRSTIAPVHSSAVVFTNNSTTVEFCHPSMFSDFIDCVVYQKVD